MSVSSDEEDLDCPLCMEEIDITDRYFKPCPCGYQICRFCWNHIKENLNGLCPACRRPYSEDTVEFRPVPPEEIARIKAAKKKKERERKEQDQMSRRHLANVRIVQKNLVYVLGLPPKIASEDILRSQDYFGQYGKITRVVVNRRAHSHTPVLAQVPNTGVYITFTRKEEAARAIEAVDGSVYDGKIIRATYGTTKYCASFLKNQPCQNPGCQFLHEPGEEADSFAKEELSRMQLRERNPKPPPFPITLGGKKEEKEESALPPTASWAKPVARPQGAHHYSAASISSMSSSASGPPRSPEMDMDDVYDSNLGPLRQKSSSQLGQVASIQLGADRKAKGKNKLAVSDLPPGFASTMANQQELSLPGTPEVEQVMGSRALDESGDQQAVKGSSPGVVKRASEENASKPTSQDELDDAVSPSAMGFILHPKYIGPFDPFREDPLAVFATISVPLQEEGSGFGSNGVSSLAIPTPNAEGGRFDAFHETQAPPRSNSRASDSGQRSRFERFFGNGQISDADGSFDASDAGEKPKEESKTVQSFRAMFPNVNVSFASGSLSEAEARWGESFSPSKLAVPDASAEAWSHGQGFPLRSQTQQMAFQGGLRGVAGQQQYGSSNSLAMRQQEQLLHQQQYLSSLSHNQQVQPHLLSQLQQLRLAQMQQQQQHFAGVPHSLHPHQQPQDELIGQLLRDAQLRETHIRQDQIRELQMRAAAGAGQSRGEVSFRDPAIMSVKLNNPTAGGAAPGFEGRTRPRTFEGVAPSQGQSLDYQQEWPSPPGTSALGPGYVTNVRFGEWGGSISASEGDHARGFDSSVPSRKGSPTGASPGEATGTGSARLGSRAGRRDDGEGGTPGNEWRNEEELQLVTRLGGGGWQAEENTEDTSALDAAASSEKRNLDGKGEGKWDVGTKGPGIIAPPIWKQKSSNFMVRKTGPQSGPGIDGERDGDDHQQSGSVDVLRSPRTPNLSQAVIEGADSGGSSATQSRPQTPVMPSGTPPPKISSPTPRRVLTITPAKKPPQSAVNVPVGTFSEAAKDSERRDATATPNIPDRDQAQAGKDKRERNGTALSVGIISAQANEKDGKVRDARRKASKIDSKVSSASEKMSEKAAEKETEKEAYTSLEQEEITTEKGRPLTPLSSPKMRKKRSKTKVDDAAGTQVVTVTGAAKDKDVVDHIPTPPPVEPEVEAIVSRKTKKRKEKKVAVRQAPKHVPLQARLSETQSQPLESSPAASQSANIIPNGLKEKLETLGLDFDRVPSTRAANNLGNLSSKLTEGSNLVESSKPQKKQQQAASLDRRVPASQPPPPRRDISVPRKPSRCQTQRHAGEVDITSFLTSHNAATGEVDLQIDSEALANALNQLGAGYGYSSYTVDHAGENGHVNVRIDVQGKTEAPAGGKEGKSTPGHTCTPEATASFDLSTLGINIGQLDQLAANLGSFSFGGAEPAHANNSCGDGTVNVNVNGVAMNIDANAFIDQALEGLATTAAFLYEGLEAQVEKVRREEEVKSKSKTKGKGEVGGPKSSMQRVSEQVTKLEEYAAKLQNKFRNGLDPAGESTASSTEHGVPGATVCGKKLKKAKGLGSSSGTGAGTRYTATFTVSSGSSARDTPIDQTSPISEMFGVGLNPATAGWTTEDWKAKCRSVEIVMKRVREAREMRRRQREEEPGTGTAADGSSQGLNMLDALSQAAIGAINGLDHGLESDHDEYPSNGDIDYGNIGDDEQSVTSSGFATPSATEASSPPTDAQNLFENNHIQRLLETVRILVSTGEMLVNAPSTAMMANTSDSTQPLHGLKKKKKRSSSPQPPQTYSNYGQGQELDASSGVGVLVDEHGRPMDATLMDVNGRGRGRIELTNVVAYNSQGELAPIVFDPAPLLAAVASGAVAPGVPIPWEVFGLRGPPPSWQGQSTEHPHSAGVPMDVEILERELEVSRREEQELEKRLVEVVRRNGQWQTEVAKVLELEVNVSDAYQVEVLHEQYEDAVEFDADEEFAEGAEQIACSHGVPMIGTR